MVFSRLVPNQLKLEQSKAYLIAKSLGANVTQRLTDETTHLVAATSGTFKEHAARKQPGISVVTPEWLWSCAERWECVEEKLFPLDPLKPSTMRQPPPHCHSPGIICSRVSTLFQCLIPTFLFFERTQSTLSVTRKQQWPMLKCWHYKRN